VVRHVDGHIVQYLVLWEAHLVADHVEKRLAQEEVRPAVDRILKRWARLVARLWTYQIVRRLVLQVVEAVAVACLHLQPLGLQV